MTHLKSTAFLSCLFLFLQGNAQNKHALIFAIGDYPKWGGWDVISSVRDVDHVKTALTRQGFNDIRIIKDTQATKAGIVAAINRLINDVPQNSSGTVVIHFSSHGGQVEDDNGDEPDGLDEAIATYKAIAPRLFKKDVKKYDLQKVRKEFFTDDEFGQLINQLRSKLGKDGDVVVFMDACHSGTGTRGFAKARGGQPPLVSEKFNQSKYSPSDTTGVFKEKAAVLGDESTMATYVVFSAAKAEQLNFETYGDDGKPMGALSYTISKIFENLPPGTTYRSIFAKIQSVMSEKVPGQNPVIEGTGIDRGFFGGRYVKQESYIGIMQLKDKEITLNGGLFVGLDVGAKVAVYPAGTTDPKTATAITSGTITRSSNYTAQVQLEKNLGLTRPADGWVFVTVPAFKTEPITLNIPTGRSRGGSNSSFAETEAQAIKERLKEINVKYDGVPELVLVKGSNRDSLFISKTEYLYRTIPAGNIKELSEAIQQYAQYKFLQSFNAKDDEVQFEIQLVPSVNGKPDTTQIDSKIKNGIHEFTEGDVFFLRIKNNSVKPIYVNIMDLQPDGKINPVLPNSRERIVSSELKINPKQTRLFSNYKITVYPPYGTELFKVFASTKELDLEGIATTRSVRGRGNLWALEKVVKNSYQAGTRGGKGENIESTDGTTENLLFEIKRKNTGH